MQGSLVSLGNSAEVHTQQRRPRLPAVFIVVAPNSRLVPSAVRLCITQK
jgi:hypothetical protein